MHKFSEICGNFPHISGQKVLKFEFAMLCLQCLQVIIIFVKSIKKGIEWYIHFIGQ